MSVKFSKTFSKIITVLLIALLALAALPASEVYASTSGPNYPTAGADVTGIGTITWSAPGRISSNNNQSTFAAVPVNDGTTHYLMGTGYGFAIPANASITGIQVTIGRYSSGIFSPLIRDNVVSLVKAGSIVGDNKAAATMDWPTSETPAYYGGTSDLWGTTWTPADINNANFGVVLSVINSQVFFSRTAYVDYITITVTYGTATTLDVTALTDTYGDTVMLSATLSPAVSGKSISFALDNAAACDGTTLASGVATCTATLNTNFGYYASGVSASFAGDSVYAPSSATADLTVNKRPITVTAVTDTKVYDGATASSGVPTITLGSLASGDSATWTQAFDSKNVGSGKTLTPAGSVSDGNGGLNYAVSFVNDTTGEITARAITVTAATDTKEYDGTTGSSGVPTITLGSLASGESATWTQVFDSKNVGSGKTLTPAGSVSDGNGGLNYAVTFVNDTTGEITARAITVTAATDTKEYDGTTGSSGVPTITLGSLASGESATWTQAFDSKNVGSGKTLTPAGSVSDGNGGLNYAVSFVNDTTGEITARAITVTAATDTKVYDGTTGSTGLPTITLGGLASGDSAAWTQAFDSKNVGSGKTLTPTGSVSDGNGGLNYAVTFVNDTTGEITARAITVTAATDTKEYDGTTVSSGIPTIILGSLASGDSATWTQVFDSKNVGSGKTLTPTGSVSDGNGGLNYAVSFANDTTGEITARAITVTAATDTKVYDGTTGSTGLPTITLGGLASGDSAAWTQAFDSKNVGSGKTLTPAGSVSDGNGGLNYSVSFANDTTGEITARAITVTAATDTKVYDGTTGSTGLPTITLGGLASGDSAAWTQAFDSKNVGSGKTLTPTGSVSDGNGGLNYAVTFVNDTTGVITARAITVTADAKTKVFGSQDPELTFAVIPALMSGDQFSGSLTRTAGEDVGAYPILIGTLSAGDNYAVTYTGANLTVTRANQTITVTTHAPVTAAGGSTFTVAATSDSGLAITFSASGACTNIGSTFTMTSSTGSCLVRYDQDGNTNYNPAPQVVETVLAYKMYYWVFMPSFSR